MSTFAAENTVSACRWPMCQRKVRAAKGSPLLKVEAIGDSRCRQKRMTASIRWGKGEKVV